MGEKSKLIAQGGLLRIVFYGLFSLLANEVSAFLYNIFIGMFRYNTKLFEQKVLPTVANVLFYIFVMLFLTIDKKHIKKECAASPYNYNTEKARELKLLYSVLSVVSYIIYIFIAFFLASVKVLNLGFLLIPSYFLLVTIKIVMISLILSVLLFTIVVLLVYYNPFHKTYRRRY